MPPRLIINADDYGVSREVDEAIEELIAAGCLTDVSVLANGPRVELAIEKLRSSPGVSVGVHLNVVEFQPLSDSRVVEWLIDRDGNFVGLSGLLRRWGRHPGEVSRAIAVEWERQIRYLLDAGLEITHVDSHRHLHALPGAWGIALRLCRDYGIGAMRLPLERNGARQRPLGTIALRGALAVARRGLEPAAVIHNDHFLGFKRAGGYGLQELLGDLAGISAGVTELALHPSRVDGSPYPGMSGDRERRALLDADLPRRLAAMGIERISWGDLLDEAS